MPTPNLIKEDTLMFFKKQINFITELDESYNISQNWTFWFSLGMIYLLPCMGLDSKDKVFPSFQLYINFEGILKYFVGFEISVHVSKWIF